MIYFIFIVWILAAAITLKADAIIMRRPTDYGDWWLALLFWWLVAILILTDKHECYGNDHKTEYHY